MILSTCLEEEREGMITRWSAFLSHPRIEKDGIGWIGAAGVGSNDGVPHEGIGFLGVFEELSSVSDIARIREGAEGHDSAGGEVVGDATGDYHLGVDLFEVVHGGALISKER